MSPTLAASGNSKPKDDFKQPLRRSLSGLLGNLQPEKKLLWDTQITQNLAGFIKTQEMSGKSFSIVGLYSPFSMEPEWDLESKVTNLLNELNKKSAYPTMIGDQMGYRQSQRSELIWGNEFGKPIFRPAVTCPIVNPEILIIPGLGFSLLGGMRLGRGKGHYDRYLSAHPGVLKVGIAFELQFINELPKEDHDVGMDYIVTEKDVYKI